MPKANDHLETLSYFKPDREISGAKPCISILQPLKATILPRGLSYSTVGASRDGSAAWGSTVCRTPIHADRLCAVTEQGTECCAPLSTRSPFSRGHPSGPAALALVLIQREESRFFRECSDCHFAHQHFRFLDSPAQTEARVKLNACN